MSDDRLCLMSIHAHPDDESSKGASTVAKYHAEGIETVLVCCTGGEAGDILNPAMDSEDVRSNLPSIRRQELDAAVKIIGYEHLELLGYRDSGMAGTPTNDHPGSFARADTFEAVGQMVALIRRYRPDVLVTYGDEQEIYPHPDHLRVHDVSVAAYAAADDPSAYPEAGEPWKPKKLYYSVWGYNKQRLLHDTLQSMGIESPFPSDWSVFTDFDHRITTHIDVHDWLHVRAEALRAHASQIAPDDVMWFGLPDDIHRTISGTDDYVLVESSVETSLPESDLFAGLR